MYIGYTLSHHFSAQPGACCCLLVMGTGFLASRRLIACVGTFLHAGLTATVRSASRFLARCRVSIVWLAEVALGLIGVGRASFGFAGHRPQHRFFVTCLRLAQGRESACSPCLDGSATD